MMRIGLQTWGTDGDIRPFIALAGGLSANGHHVTLAVTSVDTKDYTSYAQSLNFEIIHAHDTYRKWGADRVSQVKRNIVSTKPIDQVTHLYEDLLEPAVDEMYEISTRLCNENDAVVGYFILHPLQLAALKKGRPYATAVWSPDFYPSRHRPPSSVPDLGAWMNPWWWKLAKRITNRMILKYANRLRRREGYPAATDVFSELWESKTLTLVAASPSLFERPADWSDHLQVCGFLGVPEEAEKWVMPEDLARFISEGNPPVYMTFGSMPQTQTATELFIDAVRAAGCRAIIQARWSALPDVGDDPNIYRIEGAPHHRIFPHCSLVVHHGGAGTSHSASLAGCPSVVEVHFGDQIFWGAQLKRAGLVNKVLHERSVTSKTLAAEIRSVLRSSAMKERAFEISESMRKEQGVKRAVALIERYLTPPTGMPAR
jgi:UDP:flavonoid glycosyltransferase YjiC (YdhE family)